MPDFSEAMTVRQMTDIEEFLQARYELVIPEQAYSFYGTQRRNRIGGFVRAHARALVSRGALVGCLTELFFDQGNSGHLGRFFQSYKLQYGRSDVCEATVLLNKA